MFYRCCIDAGSAKTSFRKMPSRNVSFRGAVLAADQSNPNIEGVTTHLENKRMITLS